MLTDADVGCGSVRFAKGVRRLPQRGHGHIDVLCHAAYAGSLYERTTDKVVTAGSAAAGAIDVLENGLVGRGVGMSSSTAPLLALVATCHVRGRACHDSDIRARSNNPGCVRALCTSLTFGSLATAGWQPT